MSRTTFAALLGLALALLIGVATAQPAPSAVPSAAPSGAPAASGSAAPGASGSAAPATSGSAAPAASGRPPPGPPPGHGGGAGLFQAQPDRVVGDPKLPPGTLVIEIVDAEGKPLPGTEITLQRHISSVTEGDSTNDQTLTTDDEGNIVLKDVMGGRGVGYRVVATNGPATFASQEFGMSTENGMRVQLHVYEPVRDLLRTPFVMEAVVLLEVKPEHVVVNTRLVTMNLGSQAYVPQGVTLPLPAGFEAFNDAEAMGLEDAGQKVVEEGGVAKLVGTFPPGRAQIFFRYQVPNDAGETAQLRIPMPPRVVGTQVVVGASPGMGMTIPGFPAAEVDRWQDGKRVLVTTKRPDLQRGVQAILASVEPTTLDITLTGIPVPGPGRKIAVGIGILTIILGALGLAEGRKRKGLSADQRQDLQDARKRLLREIELLERARAKGKVSPRNYERIRVALLDALARIVGQLGKDPESDDGTSRKKRGRKTKRKRAAPAS